MDGDDLGSGRRGPHHGGHLIAGVECRTLGIKDGHNFAVGQLHAVRVAAIPAGLGYAARHAPRFSLVGAESNLDPSVSAIAVTQQEPSILKSHQLWGMFGIAGNQVLIAPRLSVVPRPELTHFLAVDRRGFRDRKS